MAFGGSSIILRRRNKELGLKLYRSMKGPLLPLALLTTSFVISIALYVFFRPVMTGAIFYFPLNSGERIGAEKRGIPARRDHVEQMATFVQELLLGPVDLALAPIVPLNTKLRHIAMLGKTGYLDFSIDVYDMDTRKAMTLDEALSTISMNLSKNFPRLKAVQYTIDGIPVVTRRFHAESGENDIKQE